MKKMTVISSRGARKRRAKRACEKTAFKTTKVRVKALMLQYLLEEAVRSIEISKGKIESLEDDSYKEMSLKNCEYALMLMSKVYKIVTCLNDLGSYRRALIVVTERDIILAVKRGKIKRFRRACERAVNTLTNMTANTLKDEVKFNCNVGVTNEYYRNIKGLTDLFASNNGAN